ncbi:thymidylate synthase [Granulicatella sp. zg-ZJ]|uniref:thymidylate synthase n=1 Tax=unclassified Granulicatella TaxID=2630493 RepID=UPI0013C0FC61|nr:MULTISPECIES: thymidylate synthase [unclassified Granulicatella]MBS4749663.1 thymidylate synthase [Carnobacteriaceae bacterium zg-ZUI78]NEW61792.1 thymidylate synthase [Granulicatella sp. zg-ZJ]NEW66823.1 thymidylate synthase [Granulicatella sp. zg-84]QMI86440.1 thymidylate synthase [Carnobacteriaceae bacterium zg-84]
MKQYLDFLQKIVDEGVEKSDRTGTGTKSIFGYQMRFNLQEGFPIVTTKSVPFGLIKSELLWFLHGDNNLKYLLENNNHIWDEWGFKRYVESPDYTGPDMTDFGRRCLVDEAFNALYQQEMQKYCQQILEDDIFAQKHGSLGNIYGVQWRHWKTTDGNEIDQIQQVIDTLKTNPDSRRIIVSAWNPEEVPSMALPPCHTMFQFYVVNNQLSCQLYQRSGDAFLGIPFNIASYALLTHLIANEVGLEVGEFVHTIGDAHIYLNHLEQVKEQLTRTPYSLPKLLLHKPDLSLFDIQKEDITLINYQKHAKITAPIAV